MVVVLIAAAQHVIERLIGGSGAAVMNGWPVLSW